MKRLNREEIKSLKVKDRITFEIAEEDDSGLGSPGDTLNAVVVANDKDGIALLEDVEYDRMEDKSKWEEGAVMSIDLSDKYLREDGLSIDFIHGGKSWILKEK